MRYFISLFLTTCWLAYAEAVPPGMQSVKSSLINRGRLSLPSIGGSIDAPSADWKWYVKDDGIEQHQVYLCTDSDEVFVVVVRLGQVDVKNAKVEDFREDLEE